MAPINIMMMYIYLDRKVPMRGGLMGLPLHYYFAKNGSQVLYVGEECIVPNPLPAIYAA